MDGRYIAIDLKSFYASCECVERDLDPLNTNLVVADMSRTEKTICLAVSPALKSLGVPGRPRLFEVNEKVREINADRKAKYGKNLKKKSVYLSQIKSDPSRKVDFIVAKPRMAMYISYSTKIYSIYLRYASPDDIHVYSIDEVFIDAAPYMKLYKKTARELAVEIIHTVLKETGITATVGIGTNLYLSKIAMDIVAKHVDADKDGVRIAQLDEISYRKLLWGHTPITDFWRIGRGIASKLEAAGMYTMGDVARMSVKNEDLLYELFGVNAELLIDHAWGFEPCRISDIKSYTPQERSVSNGQVLHKPYTFDETRLNVREMADELSMTLFEKEAVTDQLVLYIGYDAVNTENGFSGEIHINHYGKTVPAGARGSLNLGLYTNSSKIIVSSALKLYDSIADKNLLSRRIYIVANHAKSESEVMAEKKDEQLSFFVDYDKKSREEKELGNFLEKEKKQQSALLSIQKKFGKNSIFKASDLEENATAIERNNQIGGHASGENSETQSDDVRWAALKETSEKRESMKKNAELFSGKSIDFSCGSGYDDMIYLSPHKSAARPKMSLHDRAAQFSPFDALKGFDEAVRETSKLTKSKVIHSSDMDEETNESLVKIAENIDSHPEVEVKYFSSDESKSGGDYMIKKGFVKKIDALSGKMIFEDGGNVKINDIDFVEILNKEGRA